MSAMYATKRVEPMLPREAAVDLPSGTRAAPGQFKQHEYKDGVCIHCQRNESYSHLPCEHPSANAADYEHVYEILP